MKRQRVPGELHDRIEEVVERNADDLLRYLRRRVEQREDAADLLGHVLMALWETGARIPANDVDARMWCFGIARNVLHEHYRQQVKRISLANELREQIIRTSPQDNAADTAAETGIRAQTVRSAVASLDKRSRELVTLIHWDGFSIAEAARLLAMNESTARTRYSRALKRLQKDLADGAVYHDGHRSHAQPDGAINEREPSITPASTQNDLRSA